MKKALFVTDCSVDSALTLRHWLTQPAHQAIHLTVVYPYALTGEQLLHKDLLRPARTEADERLKQWTLMLGNQAPEQLSSQTLFADPDHALRLHLYLRQYDYCLLDHNSALPRAPINWPDSHAQPVFLPETQTAALA